ncbi:MAG: hypothetical protein M3400_10675 [Actinomycetota bacterium]|nr:hypothetical protein [Actinomycetota bacterium]
MEVEKRGTPAVLIATEVFVTLARAEAEAFGIPTFDVLVVPHPLASLAPQAIHRHGEDLVGDVVRVLTLGVEH